MKKRPQVALLIETSNSYARGLLRGIRRYRSEGRNWTVYLPEQGRGDAPPRWLHAWRGDGVIARIENPRIAAEISRAGLPTVDVSAGRLLPECPMVETDNEVIGRLAFEHLRDRGLRQFGFCGDDRFAWSRLRSAVFARLAAENQSPCSVYPAGKRKKAGVSRDWEDEQADLAAWLKALPKPAGVMACYDIRGWQVLELCRRLSIRVPDEVAVIGVDNDELLCDLSQPPLSSVIPDTDRTGYEAAALLDRMLAGRKVPPDEHLIQPLGVATRQSTDVLAIDDEDLAAGLRLIRDHACDGIHVDDILARLAISRRVFESRFKKRLGRTPHEEIVRLQMQRVMDLLTQTDLPLLAISERAGFKHVEYMSTAFKQHTGHSPRDYRLRQRANRDR